MKFHDVEQNTDEWLDLRCGKLTSSSLAKVMANYGKPFGAPAKGLAVQIAVEQITGSRSSASYSNAHMERGHEQEPIARMLYEEENFCTVTNGGFLDCGFMGCSTDGMIDENGIIEIKSAIPSIHFERVRKQGLDPTYKWQCLSNLKLWDREWLDFVSYCGEFPEDGRLYTYRIYAEKCAEEFAMIDARVGEFIHRVAEAKDVILSSNYKIK